MDDAKKAVLLFIEKDENKAMEIGSLLQTDNSDRKEIDSDITQEALNIIQSDNSFADKKACVLYREHWHKGVVGIVASRIIEHHYKPTIVLTKSGDTITGSARSIKGFNLYEAIYQCKDHLLHYGGHFAAAGLSLLPENLKAFSDKFYEVTSNTIDESLLTPEIIVDAEINLNEINLGFFNILSQMEPFGPDNMNPVFIVKNIINNGYSKILKDKHIKFEVLQNNSRISGIGFNMADKFNLLQNKQPVDIVFSLEENEYNGNISIQMKVIDFRKSQQ
jgi:single-stranded-DNA-specific exonuclease